VSNYAWSGEFMSCLPALGIAVGTSYQALPGATDVPAILLWDGKDWKLQTLPAGLPASLQFTSVAFTSKTTAYAAGSGYLLNWNGAVWSIVKNGSNALQPGDGAFVASNPAGGLAVTLGASADAKSLASYSGPHVTNSGEAWMALPVAADITDEAGAVTALSGGCSDSGPWATTQYQVLRYAKNTANVFEWQAMTQPNPLSYTALAAACCNPYTVWVAASHPMTGTSLNKWDLKNGYLTGQPAGSAAPPFADGYAFNDISASDGATAWAVGAGLPQSVGVILGFNNNTQSWPVMFDGRKVTPNVPPLRGSFTLSKYSAVAVGDGGAVVWWNGVEWKAGQVSEVMPGSATYKLQAVALYGGGGSCV
jgi:hypothetical protein